MVDIFMAVEAASTDEVSVCGDSWTTMGTKVDLLIGMESLLATIRVLSSVNA